MTGRTSVFSSSLAALSRMCEDMMELRLSLLLSSSNFETAVMRKTCRPNNPITMRPSTHRRPSGRRRRLLRALLPGHKLVPRVFVWDDSAHSILKGRKAMQTPQMIHQDGCESGFCRHGRFRSLVECGKGDKMGEYPFQSVSPN